MSAVALQRDPRDLVDEYEAKKDQLQSLLDNLNNSVEAIKVGSTIGGTFGRRELMRREPLVDFQDIEAHLLSSAWWAAWAACGMETLATANDKARATQDFQNPPPFTVENLVATFGPYLANQREHILRGLAEAFCALDDAYKSHSKVKIGVKGLPKRVIVNQVVNDWGGRGHGWDQVKDLLNALSIFNGEGVVGNSIIYDIGKGRDTWRGLAFKRFQNGNWHIHFDQDACRQINLALAEYYGAVLPDVEPDKDDIKADPKARDLSKDLQYYPTPQGVVKRVMDVVMGRVGFSDETRVLEPSCGCGRLMDGLREGARLSRVNIEIDGVEYDRHRVAEARAKGFRVTEANFLQVAAVPAYNLVVMNPPFYGRHYLKHILHALSFLKPGGSLISILPATAHYDHGKLPVHRWIDLPVGSFAESGTRVPTGIAIIEYRDALSPTTEPDQ